MNFKVSVSLVLATVWFHCLVKASDELPEVDLPGKWITVESYRYSSSKLQDSLERIKDYGTDVLKTIKNSFDRIFHKGLKMAHEVVEEMQRVAEKAIRKFEAETKQKTDEFLRLLKQIEPYEKEKIKDGKKRNSERKDQTNRLRQNRHRTGAVHHKM